MEFANTLDERSFSRHGMTHSGGDDLSALATATRWLRRHELLTPSAELTPSELSIVVAFRRALRSMLAARGGEPLGERSLEELNDTLSRLPLTVQFGADGSPRLISPARGLTAALAHLAALVAENAARGTWHRLRMCAAPDCRWVFYDTSRNGGGRWCSMAVCGNRDKTRRYRERHARD